MDARIAQVEAASVDRNIHLSHISCSMFSETEKSSDTADSRCASGGSHRLVCELREPKINLCMLLRCRMLPSGVSVTAR